MKENKNTKSLFLYTALIFLVALLMIIISFFGQNHADKLKETEQRAKTITEKASALSDENLRLTERIAEYEQKNGELQAELEKIKSDMETINIQISNESKVIEACNDFFAKRYSSASAILDEVNPDALTPQVKKLYDTITAKVK